MPKRITNKQAENTRVAYAIMAGVPAEKIELNSIRNGDARARYDRVSDRELLHECGTSGCVAGWLAAHPYFKKQGLGVGIVNNLTFNRYGTDIEDPSNVLFGVGNIFDAGPSGVQGKKQALYRLRMHLFKAGRITAERNEELAWEEFAAWSVQAVTSASKP